MDKGFCGLSNPKNDCYMNCVLQVFLNLLDKNDIPVTTDISATFFKLFNVYNNESLTLAPTTLKKLIRKELKFFEDQDIEHDANEFFLQFLELLSKNSQVKNESESSEKEPKKVTFDTRGHHQFFAEKEWISHFKGESDTIETKFYGQFMKRYRCLDNDCLHSFFRYEPFNTIYIFPSANKKISDLINNSFDRDYVNLTCESCNPGQDITKEHSLDTIIYKCPEILIVTVNRFNAGIEKRNDQIVLEEEIDLYYNYFGNDKGLYKLHSVICHIGESRETGHYISVIRKKTGYYVFDDSKISKLAKLSDLNGSYIYMVVYKRI
jgi:ubiquitin C-terminal hydrolase